MDLGTITLVKNLEKRSKAINNIVLIVMPIAAIVGAYVWYREHIWQPTVKVITTDYENGVATIDVNGKTKMLYYGSVLNAGSNWGVAFAGEGPYSRIEVLKNGLTHATIDINNTNY